MPNIFIGGMASAMTEAELRNLFEPYGAIEKVTIVRDRESGRSRGFGFVEMTNENEAATAIAALNGKTFAGRKITVNEGRKRPQSVGSQQRQRRSG
jgi:cold-inducible RNA-binding protein